MKTLDEVLELMDRRIDRPTLEDYITRDWIRPSGDARDRHFDEMDIARLRLVCHLARDIEINDQGMDVVLSLLDQLYELRTHMKALSHAVTRQPQQVRVAISAVIRELAQTKEPS